MRSKWVQEKNLVDKIQQDKRQMERLRFEADKAEREGNYGKVAEIRYGKLKDLEEDIRRVQREINAQGAGKMVREEVTADDIAEVVSRWTGIPVTRMGLSFSDEKLNEEYREFSDAYIRHDMKTLKRYKSTYWYYYECVTQVALSKK